MSVNANGAYSSPLALSLAEDVLERLLRYARVDTQSAAPRKQSPSTPGQLDLARLLIDELNGLGLHDAVIDDNGYVIATLTGEPEQPVIGLIAHLDVSPDAPASGVEPLVHRDYDGGVIALPRGGTVLDPQAMPELLARTGNDLVTSSGDTLLGADDKAGIAEIMAALAHLVAHPELPRPTLKVCFTPDEEIGQGGVLFDIERFGALCAYTLDGSEPGELQDETFSAAAVKLTIDGVAVHPGFAKDRLVNAAVLAARIVEALPRGHLTPETTSGREGFIHVLAIHGAAEQATIETIVRDFDDELLQAHIDLLSARRARDRRRRAARAARYRGDTPVPEHAPLPRAAPPRPRRRRAGDPRRGLRAAAHLGPRRHRRLGPQPARAADAEPLHRRPRVPLTARMGLAAGDGGRRRGRRPPGRGLGVLVASSRRMRREPIRRMRRIAGGRMRPPEQPDRRRPRLIAAIVVASPSVLEV